VDRVRIHLELDGDASVVRAGRQRFARRRRNGLVLPTDLDEQWNVAGLSEFSVPLLPNTLVLVLVRFGQSRADFGDLVRR
jgi:hypothetical protein